MPNDFAKCASLVRRLDAEARKEFRRIVQNLESSEIQQLPSAKNNDVASCLKILDKQLDYASEYMFGWEFLELTQREQNQVVDILSFFKDESNVETYSSVVGDWCGGGVVQKSPKLSKIIIQGVPVMKKVFPYKRVPKVLYRGLDIDKKLKKDQRFFYLSRPPRLLSGWSTDRDVAKSFGDILLTAEGEDIERTSIPVLWPGVPGSDGFKSEKKWVLYIKKPLPVQETFDYEY